jgi:hypothetical protein
MFTAPRRRFNQGLSAMHATLQGISLGHIDILLQHRLPHHSNFRERFRTKHFAGVGCLATPKQNGPSAGCSVLELSTPRALGARGRDHFMMVYVYQEKIAPPGLLPVRTKPPDVPTLQYIIKSLEQENASLKEQLARIVRDK